MWRFADIGISNRELKLDPDAACHKARCSDASQIEN